MTEVSHLAVDRSVNPRAVQTLFLSRPRTFSWKQQHGLQGSLLGFLGPEAPGYTCRSKNS